MSNNYLGDFTSIGAVWSKYPEGGKPNDFLTVNGVRYTWCVQLNSWITPNQMQGRGWGADNVNGDLYIENDLRVGGTVYANNIRHPYKGLFGSFEQLKRYYPNPKPGDFADVGYTSPSTRYACEVKHEWTDTGQEGVDPSVILPPELSDMELISRWGYVDDDARLTVDFSQRKVSWGESSVHFGKLKKVDIQQGEHLAQSSMSSSEKVGYLVFDKVERIFNYYTPSTVPPTTDDIVLIAVFIDKKVSFSTSLIFDGDGKGISPLQILNDTIGTPGDEANAAGTIFSRIAFLANEIGERNEAPDIVGKIFGRLNYLTPISRKAFNLTLIESLTESSSVEDVMSAFTPENFDVAIVPDSGDYLLGKVNPIDRNTQKAVVQNVSYSSDVTRRIQIVYNVGYGVTVVTINSQWRFLSKKRFGLPNFEAESDVENAQLSDFGGVSINPKSVAKNISTVDGGNVEAKLSDLDNRVTSQKADVDAAKNEALEEINKQVLSFNEGVTPEMLSEATIALINASGGGTIINQADDEDLKKETTQGGTEVIKFADKAYAPGQFSGLARKFLRKNMSDDANVLTQDMVNESNTIYHIQYDYDLQGATITIPSKSILKFEGGSLRNGTIVCDNTTIETKNACFNSDLVLNGTVYKGAVYFDWFVNTKITNEEYNLSTSLSVESNNDLILKNILANTNLTELVFGKGIYLFKEEVLIKRSFNGYIFRGVGKKQTCLYFTDSKGFRFYSGNCDFSIFKDFTIHSKLECFYIEYRTDEDRFNAFYDNILSDIEMISNEGEFCFGANRNFASFIYHNQFTNIGFYGENGFARVAGLGTLYKGLYDCYTSFTHGNLVAITKDRSVFFNCSDMFIYDSNFTYNGLSHICKFISSETEADLRIELTANNCNFESFTNSFVYTTGVNALIYINFVNCSFTTRRDIIDDSFYHFNISRCSMFKGVPSSIFNDTDQKFYPLSINVSPESNLDYDTEMSYQADVKYTLLGNNNIKERLDVGKNYSRMPLRDNIAYITEYSKNSASIKTDVDLTVKDTIESNYQAYPKLVRIINSSSDKNVLNITGIGTNQFDFGECTSNGNSVTFLNNSKYIVYVKDQITKQRIIPNFQVVFNHYGLYTDCKHLSNVDGSFRFVTLGDVIDNKQCVAENSGIYIPSSGYDRNTLKLYNLTNEGSQLDSYCWIVNNGYIYKCVKSGLVASTIPDEYNTKINENDIVVDGDAEFVCVGKMATFVNISGTTEQRSEDSPIGFQYFDTTLNKPIWKTETGWVDATGAEI